MLMISLLIILIFPTMVGAFMPMPFVHAKTSTIACCEHDANKKSCAEKESSITTNTTKPFVTNIWGAIKSSQIIDGFLEVPMEMVSFTSDKVISSVYIRPDYEEVFDLIKNHVNTVRSIYRKSIIHIVVTGTPGIGKSWFAYYFLWRTLEDETFKNKKRYFQTSPDCIEYLSDDGEKIKLTAEQKDIASLDFETILLVDMDERAEPAKWYGVTIVLSSPDVVRFKEFLKRANPVKYFINPWPKDCIIKVWEKLYKETVSLEDVDKIYKMYGGVIRYVLEQNKDAEKKMKQAFQKIRNFKVLAKAISKSAVDDTIVTYKLLHYHSNDQTEDTAQLYLASDYVAGELFANIKEEDSDEALTFLGGSEMGYVQSTMGILFETVTHNKLCKIGLPALRRVMKIEKSNKSNNRKRPEKGTELRNLTLPKTFTVNAATFENQVPEIFHNFSALQQLSKGVYYRPDIGNQASLDSFAVLDNNVFAYQITNAIKHPVKASGLNDLHKLVVRCFPGEELNYHLVFICPKGTVNTKRFTSQTVGSQADPLLAGALPFKMNQWIAEVQFLPSFLQNHNIT